jgi:hypothetical protein
VLEELSWIGLGAVLILVATVAAGGVDLDAFGGGSSAAEPQSTVAQVKGSTSPRRTAPVAQPAPTPLNELVVAAVRGDCWVSLRRGSASGAVLYEGLLTRGRRARARGGRVFVRLGAAQNVELTVRGKRRPVSPGTVDLVIDVSAPRGS